MAQGNRPTAVTLEVSGGEERSLISGPTAPSPPVHRFVRHTSIFGCQIRPFSNMSEYNIVQRDTRKSNHYSQ